MTVSQELNTLLAEIDHVLATPIAPEVRPERQMLQRVRDRLAQWILDGGGALSATERQAAQHIAQAVIAQIELRREDWIQPLKVELEALRQHKQQLTSEIQQLEQQQRERANQLIDQLLVQWRERLPAHPDSAPHTAPMVNLAQLQQVQTDADQLIHRLDSTMRTVFETLLNNLRTYETSLGQGMDRLHELGRQGEWLMEQSLHRLQGLPHEPAPDLIPLPLPGGIASLEVPSPVLDVAAPPVDPMPTVEDLLFGASLPEPAPLIPTPKEAPPPPVDPPMDQGLPPLPSSPPATLPVPLPTPIPQRDYTPPSDPEQVRTIRLLTDLVVQDAVTLPPQEDPLVEPLAMEPTESLMPPTAIGDRPEPNAMLDSQKLAQLQADLQSFGTPPEAGAGDGSGEIPESSATPPKISDPWNERDSQA